MTGRTPGRFVAYLRVSTDGQGRSGLGLEAQRQAVTAYVAQAGGEVVAEFQEVESGKRADRPQLAAALASCRTRRAVLVIAKLDRLARNARFLLSVVEGSGEAGVVFCDLPTVPAGPIGKFLVTQMAAVAELEAGLISQRTRAALAVAKARGVRLGNPFPIYVNDLRHQDGGAPGGLKIGDVLRGHDPTFLDQAGKAAQVDAPCSIGIDTEGSNVI